MSRCARGRFAEAVIVRLHDCAHLRRHRSMLLVNRLLSRITSQELTAARKAAEGLRVQAPRVGLVRATLDDAKGERLTLSFELSANRTGGMVIESRCSCSVGQQGRPCEHLVVVLLEIENRGLFSSIREQTPVILKSIPAETVDDDAAEESNPSGISPARAAVVRQPPWANELEERRRLVEPAVRINHMRVTDARRGAGMLVFLIDLVGSTESNCAIVKPCRMQLDVVGNVCGRPRPITLGEIDGEPLDSTERMLISRLLGALGCGDDGAVRRGDAGRITRIAITPASAGIHLSHLCETGRLFLQPDPRRSPEVVMPLAWDNGRAWRFALVLDPDDVPSASDDDEDVLPPRPAKARLRGMLVRGSQRMALDQPKAVLRSGLVIFADRIALLESDESSAWLDQFERRGPIELASSHVDGLIERLAGMCDMPRIELPAWTGWKIESAAPIPRLVLDDGLPVNSEELDDELPSRTGRRRKKVTKTQLAGHVWFDYGGLRIAAHDPSGGAVDQVRHLLVRRNRIAERSALSVLAACGAVTPKEDGEPSTHHVEFARNRLDSAAPQMASEGWEVEVSGKRYRPAGTFSWHVASGIDWFELSGSFNFDGIEVGMPSLLEAIERGDSSVQLPDGSLGILPADWARQMAPMIELAQRSDGKLRYGRIQVALLDALLAGQPRTEVDEAFEKIREELSRGEQPDAIEEPEGFKGTLRHYQREGLGWLAFLESLGVGGCLADDMGLGKTVQVLALLVRRQAVMREQGVPHRPSMVVVPKSLIFNWMQEAAKFTPSLRVHNHTGQTRAEGTQSLADTDLILTTYGTLRRDALQHREFEFDYVVLDEAQAIKNATSQAAKACRLLRARHRLADTGTPVENHIGELWSIFEFLNPGQLGSSGRLKRFLMGGRGGSASGVVARAVRPYLLRRTKSQVLTDLPEKTEQTLFCELTGPQRIAYDELKEHYRRELSGRIGKLGIGRSKIAVLEALLRLRQTACHQGLVDPARLDEPCAKLETLIEQLDEVILEGHKVLVFSQFTSFLAILRRLLEARGMPYEYLDGKTTDRQSRVEHFQDDPECKLFLVSLKAGGQGLNLTAADYIYILDPWWNPAVEAQAVDRAHRIGQTRKVFAYRLIARDTVEEKILALQDRKRDLADSIVRADESVISSLTAEDVELLFS